MGPQPGDPGAGVDRLETVLPAGFSEVVVGEVAGGTQQVLPPVPGTWLGAAAAIRSWTSSLAAEPDSTAT